MPDDHVVLVCSGDPHREAEDEQFVALAALAGSEIINGDSVGVQRQESGRGKTVGDLDGIEGQNSKVDVWIRVQHPGERPRAAWDRQNPRMFTGGSTESNPHLAVALDNVAVGNDEDPVGDRLGWGGHRIAEDESRCEVADVVGASGAGCT